jgi:outer membrane protein W
MRKIAFISSVYVILGLVRSATLAADSPTSGDPVLNGRSCLELNFGAWSGSAVSNAVTTAGVQAEVKTGAFVGGVQFTYWAQEYLAVTLSAGLLEAKISSTATTLNTGQHVSSISPVLMGVRYYLLGPDAGGTVRPYLAAAAGPYIGSEVSNTILFQGSHTETAMGGRIGAGIDFIAGYHFKFGGGVGYNLMADFGIPVGGRSNYNGGDFMFSAGYIF